MLKTTQELNRMYIQLILLKWYILKMSMRTIKLYNLFPDNSRIKEKYIQLLF